jgi:hypothetical protein
MEFLSELGFCANRLIDSHNLLHGINQFVLILSTFYEQSGLKLV